LSLNNCHFDCHRLNRKASEQRRAGGWLAKPWQLAAV
jgi:hypothetical protein